MSGAICAIFIFLYSFAPTCIAARATDACTRLGNQVEGHARTHASSWHLNSYQSTRLAERSRGKCPIPDGDLASTAKKAQPSHAIGPWARSTRLGDKKQLGDKEQGTRKSLADDEAEQHAPARKAK
jgi:hypothetical protein